MNENTTYRAPLNPWLTIWTKPRATIQQVIDTDPKRHVALLAAIAGISNVLDRASRRNLGDQLDLRQILTVAVVAGPLIGILSLYIGTAILRWTGTWLDGQANQREIRAASAWASVPIACWTPLWIPEIVLAGREMFTTATPTIEGNLTVALTISALTVVQLVAGIWTVVLFLKCLSQVQRFSVWKAVGNTLLAVMVVVVPIIAFVSTFASLTG